MLHHELLSTFSLWKDVVEIRVLEFVFWKPQNKWFRYSKKVAYEGNEKSTKNYHYFAYIDLFVDIMSHQMKGIGNGRQDV